MRKIYISEAQCYQIKEKETFFHFKSQILAFLKALMIDPNNKKTNIYFGNKKISHQELINKMLKRGMIEKKESFDEVGDESIHHIQYKIPKNKLKDGIKRLYIYYQSKILDNLEEDIDNMVNNGMTADEKYPADAMIQETDCAGVGAIGDGSDSSGQFIQPLTAVQRRTIYNPKKS